MSENTPTYLPPADDSLSGRRRRLLDAIDRLPEPFPVTRPDRGVGDRLSRHAQALRNRLDWLVRVEDDFGDEQKAVHFNRAERNALIYVFRDHLGPLIAKAAAVPAPARTPDPTHSTSYVRKIEQEIERLVADGFTVPDRAPGVLRHKSGDAVAPVEVTLPLWFYMRGLAAGGESDG